MQRSACLVLATLAVLSSAALRRPETSPLLRSLSAIPENEAEEVDKSVPCCFTTRVFEGVINDSINALSFALSQLDPYARGKLQLNFANYSAEFTDFEVRGFSDFVAEKLQYGLLSRVLRVQIRHPHIAFSAGGYNLTGPKYFGTGYYRGEVRDFLSNVDVKVSPGYPIQFQNLKFFPTIGSAKFEVTGFLLDDEVSKFVSNRITDVLNNYINANQAFVQEIISPAIQDFVNNILGGFSPIYKKEEDGYENSVF